MDITTKINRLRKQQKVTIAELGMKVGFSYVPPKNNTNVKIRLPYKD